MTLMVAIRGYLEHRKHNVAEGSHEVMAKDLRSFALFTRNPELDSLTNEMIDEWINLQLELGYKANGVRNKCNSIKKMFDYFLMRGHRVKVNPQLIEKPKQEYNMPRVATKEEYHKLLRVIPDNNDYRHIRNRAIIMLLNDTGARCGELCLMDLEMLDFKQRGANIKSEKVREQKVMRGKRPFRYIFWSEDTNEAIKKWIEKRQEMQEKDKFKDPDALFIGSARHAYGKRITPNAVRMFLTNYSRKAGIPTLNSHSFRHKLGRQIVKRQGTNADVADILGHSSLEATFIYTMSDEQGTKRKYRKFADV